MRITEKGKMIFISCIMALLILIQHRYVYMYFDDYGYASLSYAGFDNHAGMSYGLADIFQFLKAHYFNWGGRILYFFFEIILFRIGGLPIMQLTQAAIIILIAVIAGKMLALMTQANSYKCVALTLILFGLVQLKTLRDGVYWYSASVLYIWPLLPFIGSIYLCLHNEKKETVCKKILCIILVFLAAFSQEQISILTIVFYILLTLSYFADRKKIPYYLYGVCISAIVGGILTILAPGNFVRAKAGIYAEFYEKNIWSRTINNIGYIINDNAGLYNSIVIFFLTVFCGAAIALYLKSKVMAIITTIFIALLMIERLIPVSKEIGVIVGGVWLIIFVLALTVYYYRKKNFCFLALLAAGVCTQIMMIVSPAIPLRLHIMFESVLLLVLAECIIYLYKEVNAESSREGYVHKKRTIRLFIAIAIMTIYSIYNMTNIISGYKSNDAINRQNHKILCSVKNQEETEMIEKIVLYQLKNDIYAQSMPYQEEYAFIEEWMRKYYKLPDGVKLEWVSPN